MQIAIVAFLVIRIFNKKNVLGAVSVNPIKESSLDFPKNTQLKYFYEPKPNGKEVIEKKWLPYRAINTINADSLNERYDYSIKKGDRVFRIITIGDSFTYGLNISTENNYPEQLEDALNKKLKCKNIDKFEVINLGVPGYDLQYSVERFKSRGQKYDPDLVLWLITLSDISEIRELFMPLVNKYEGEIAGSKTRSYDNDPLRSEVIKKAIDEFSHKYSEEFRFNFYKNALESINQYHKKKIMLISVPGVPIKATALFQNYVSENKDRAYYLPLNKYPEDAYLADRHPSVKGHTLMVQDILGYFNQEKVIPCD